MSRLTRPSAALVVLILVLIGALALLGAQSATGDQDDATPLPIAGATETVDLAVPTAPLAPSETSAPTAAPEGFTTIQAAVDRAAPGDVVVIPAGTYLETITITKPLTLAGERGPSGELLVTLDAGWDRAKWIITASNDVTIEGIRMVAVRDEPKRGGISNDGYSNWELRDCVLDGAEYAPLSIRAGQDVRVIGCDISHGGTLGIHGSWQGEDETRPTGVLLQDNAIHDNNLDGAECGGEAGGLKITRARDMRVIGNHVYDNACHGLWFDIDVQNVLMSHNRIHHNGAAGIFYELSSGATIVNNVIWENGWIFTVWGSGAGIQVANSHTNEIADNVVAWNGNGISIVSQDRGEGERGEDWNRVDGNYVHDNIIVGTPDTVLLGWYEDWDGPLFYRESGNRGDNNRYWAPNGESRFYYESVILGRADFQDTFGEENGAPLPSYVKDTILATLGVPLAREDGS